MQKKSETPARATAQAKSRIPTLSLAEMQRVAGGTKSASRGLVVTPKGFILSE